MNHLNDPHSFNDPRLSCNREQIHLLGLVQPHGLLLVADPQTGRLLQTGGNKALMPALAKSLRERLKQSIPDLLGEEITANLDEARAGNQLNGSPSLVGYLPIGNAPGRVGNASVLAHEYRGLLIVEVEPDVDEVSNSLREVNRLINRTQATTSIDAFASTVAVEVRKLTGFDRVMIYQFMEDMGGRVIAESRADEIETSFDGLHFPASDIPPQARRLYSETWLRFIRHVNNEPASLEPAVNPQTGLICDLSRASLRGVSQAHVQYLKNMGVTASASLSLMVNGKLWGLIACHSETEAAKSSAPERSALELLAQVLSIQLQGKLEEQMAKARSNMQLKQGRLFEKLGANPERNLEKFFGDNAELICEFIDCDGLVIRLNGTYIHHGKTPSNEVIDAVAECMRANKAGPVFRSSQLGAICPQATDYKLTASGVLAIAFSEDARDCLMWFRPEITTTVYWAGKPEKVLTNKGGQMTLNPRASFDRWSQDVSGCSKPWEENLVQEVATLRIFLLEFVLKRLDELARERFDALQRENGLLKAMDQRVKMTFSTIQALVSYSRKENPDATEFLTGLSDRVKAMARSSALLRQSQTDEVAFSALLKGLLEDNELEGRIELSQTSIDPMLTSRAALSVGFVLTELLARSRLHGSLSSPDALVILDLNFDGESEDQALLLKWQEAAYRDVSVEFRRNFNLGFAERSLAYELQARFTFVLDEEGFTCKIYMPWSERVGTLPERSLAPVKSLSKRGPAVLVVEDNGLVALDLEETLRQQGYEVYGPTADLKEALALAVSKPIDLAIIDTETQGSYNWTLGDLLAGRNIPFVFASGFDLYHDLPERFSTAKVVSKPYDFDHLLVLLKNMRAQSNLAN